MLENALFTLVRSTLLAGYAARGAAYADVVVRPIYQPLTVGTPAAPQVTMQAVGDRRYGWLDRKTGLQWWETTLQIGSTARRDPTVANFMTLPSAKDICKVASDILQGDTGLAALAVGRVRPLRITEIRNLQFVNESDQYEMMPNFDVTLVYPQVVESITPPVDAIEPVFGRV